LEDSKVARTCRFTFCPLERGERQAPRHPQTNLKIGGQTKQTTRTIGAFRYNLFIYYPKIMTPFQRFTKQLPRHLYAFGVGAAAGGTIGTVGWGGAQILIPGMTWNNPLAGYSQLAATGVSLTSLSTSTLTSGYKFFHEGQVNVPIALMVGIPSVLSARLGTLWAKKLSGDALALIFNAWSIVLIPTHFWIQDRAKRRRELLASTAAVQTTNYAIAETGADTKSVTSYNFRENPQELLQFAAFGLCQGVVSSLMGVGGLPLSMSFLTEMTNLDHHHVQGTAVCAVIPSILTSAVSRIHAIPLATAGVVCFGAVVGGYGGAQFALALDDEQLRNLYMASLVLFGGRSMVGAAANIRQLLKKSASKK
jgi:uncharacterized membrane protein YfcA